jgi:hypothetical protein
MFRISIRRPERKGDANLDSLSFGLDRAGGLDASACSSWLSPAG